MTTKPLAELQGDGQPSVLNYNVPEPTSYTGRNLIELEYDPAIFRELKGEAPALPTGAVDEAAVRELLLEQSVTARRSTTLARRGTGTVSRRAAAVGESSSRAALDHVAVDVAEAEIHIKHDRVPILVPTQSGNVKVDYAPVPAVPRPAIYLVETHRLSNFLGNYGAGRTIKTFSLLPGEKTTISVTSYKSSVVTAAEASSIFDSYTEETADDFEESIQSENTDRESQEETKAWYVDAEASGNWGVFKASVAGGASGSTNTSREEFARNVSSATQKHASSASAKRDIEVNTSTTATTTETEENAVVRELTNINVSRTLNFVFRQLNQEFISILHLVDVRVGFFNGYPDTRMEVPLADLDRLLQYCVKQPADRTRIRQDVLYAVKHIRDWRGVIHQSEGAAADVDNFVVRRSFEEPSGASSHFDMINRDKKSTYAENDITVDGIILAVQKNVLRTDGMIVEAVLGQGEALDSYSKGLQEQAVIEKGITNDMARAALERERLAQEIARSGDSAKADAFGKVFQPIPEEEDIA